MGMLENNLAFIDIGTPTLNFVYAVRAAFTL